MRTIAFLALLLIGCTSTASASQLPSGEAAGPTSIDELVVYKHAHTLIAYHGSVLVRKFRVALGRGGLAPKSREGDRRVPEGQYVIAGRNPNSAYHLALRISYPTPEQVEAAAARGVKPGGDIMIHGLPNGFAWVGKRHTARDWTEGCVAVTDREIEWLWRNVPDGTPILIMP